MTKIIIYKENELVISSYDLTEQETNLVLYCISRIKPSLSYMTTQERTVEFDYQEYAKHIGIPDDLVHDNLINTTRILINRSVEIMSPIEGIGSVIFNWVGSVKINKKNGSFKLTFNDYISSILFQLEKFIKNHIAHVVFFKNKYSMRVYEWLLKEMEKRQSYNSKILISTNEFRFILMLENHKSYDLYKEFNRRILQPIANDLNKYSNIGLSIEKKGRPTNILIFQCTLHI